MINNLLETTYSSTSHTFSKGVITSYYDLLKNETVIDSDYILIRQKTRDVIFILRKFPPFGILSKNKTKRKIYSLQKLSIINKKIEEFEYNLSEF